MILSKLTRSMKAQGRKALVPFFTAGYPDQETFLRLLETASRAGSRIIEIGIPFSDPIADGPVIQASSEEALKNGMSLRKALDLAGRASEVSEAALVVMSYFNPILQMGLDPFARIAERSGIAGVIVPDLPLEESSEIRGVLANHGIAFIDLVAPTSSGDRVAHIAGKEGGFLYLVSLTGVTGVRAAVARDLRDFVRQVREQTDSPLYVGFGVSGREQAEEVVRYADGVIIGSALIHIIQRSESSEEAVENVREFLNEISQAINDPEGS